MVDSRISDHSAKDNKDINENNNYNGGESANNIISELSNSDGEQNNNNLVAFDLESILGTFISPEEETEPQQDIIMDCLEDYQLGMYYDEMEKLPAPQQDTQELLETLCSNSSDYQQFTVCLSSNSEAANITDLEEFIQLTNEKSGSSIDVGGGIKKEALEWEKPYPLLTLDLGTVVKESASPLFEEYVSTPDVMKSVEGLQESFPATTTTEIVSN